MLYSPINYQGNKSRIVCELLNLIPKDAHVIHEIFCGSAILSLASDIKCVHLNDTNHYILDLIEYFRVNTADEIIRKTDDVIFQYGLTNTYYEGRNVYVEEKHEGLSRYKFAFITIILIILIIIEIVGRSFSFDTCIIYVLITLFLLLNALLILMESITNTIFCLIKNNSSANDKDQANEPKE